MRNRGETPAPKAKPGAEKRWAATHPVNYAAPVKYLDGPRLLPETPKVNGVYLLSENDLFYIGQSSDVAARFCSHRLHPCSCHFVDPCGALLASVPNHYDTWKKNSHVRLIAEARFIAAALHLGIPLTNKLTDTVKSNLLNRFPDLSEERARIEKALQILC